eukprot:TRINITY_DN4675_c0_g2_i2.p1 TRINITY_DN4675_c0_g2~~TRINITY_DN4675_c0_g2_i2.p1  ORF type:complete len:373 (-),score=81.39 TRINITY_DN4675_c0_g2_i2:923-2041(-)
MSQNDSNSHFHFPTLVDTSTAPKGRNDALTYRAQLAHYKELSLPALKSQRQRSFPGLQNYLFAGLGAETVEENRTMREKLAEYASVSRTQRSLDEELSDVNDEEICRKLQEQGVKLNSLIARKARIRMVSAYTEERAATTKEVQYCGKIRCKGMPLALIVTVLVKQGVGSSYMYFSFTAERPDYQNYDKVVLLNKSHMTITFTEKPPKGRNFTHEWVYFSLESEKECRMTFECSFGKGRAKCNPSGVEEAEGRCTGDGEIGERGAECEGRGADAWADIGGPFEAAQVSGGGEGDLEEEKAERAEKLGTAAQGGAGQSTAASRTQSTHNHCHWPREMGEGKAVEAEGKQRFGHAQIPSKPQAASHETVCRNLQ